MSMEIYIVDTSDEVWAFTNRVTAMQKWRNLVKGRISVVKVDESLPKPEDG